MAKCLFWGKPLGAHWGLMQYGGSDGRPSGLACLMLCGPGLLSEMPLLQALSVC